MPKADDAMIAMPEEFRRFTKLCDQSTQDLSGPDRIKWMYEYLEPNVHDKTGWLRRGAVVIAFLEEVLDGPYSDIDLGKIWFDSGAETYFLKNSIRPWFTYMLDHLRTYQAQNVAGTYERYRWTGEDG